MSILVTTPTGNVGRQVAQRLLESGTPFTVLARDPARLDPAVRERSRVVVGDLTDPDAVTDALRGNHALFLAVPPFPASADWAADQRRVGAVVAGAMRANAVGRVVLLSSAGAQRDDLYAVSRLGEIERTLAAAAPHVASLRAGFFLENFLAAVPTIAADGAVYMTLPPDRRLAMVATRDIGDVAARLLLDREWQGHQVHGVHGAADHSPAEVAAALARVLGRDVRYVQIPAEAMRQALLGAGMSAHVADEYPRLMDGLGQVDYQAEPRTPATTTPTSVEAWARAVLAPAVAGFAAARLAAPHAEPTPAR
jgi:uncharacterized protein YbjT (DUF2867 family)